MTERALRCSAVLILGFGLLLLLSAPAAGGETPRVSANEQPPTPELKTDQPDEDYVYSRADAGIEAGAGVRLKLTKFVSQFEGTDYNLEACAGSSAIPDIVWDNGSLSFCYWCVRHNGCGADTGFYFYYDILIPDGAGGWRPSGYWVDGATKVPMFGFSRLECTIKRSGSMDPAPGAPFYCTTRWRSESKIDPRWKITAKEVTVIDAANSANAEQSAQLIRDNCKISDTPSCVWTRTQKSSTFLADRNDWQSLTNWADSCPPTDKNHLFVLNSNRNVQISWSDKVGGKITAKVAGDVLVFKVEGTIEANYEHSITQTDSYGEGYTYTIPYNYRSALYLQHGMLEVSGDFSIITANDRFLIKNAVFRFPLQKDVQPEGKGEPVPRGVVVHVDVPCSQEAPSSGAPPPAAAKHGLATAKSNGP